MRFFWTFRSLPELNHLTEEQKQQVIHGAITGNARRKLAAKVIGGTGFVILIPMWLFTYWSGPVVGSIAGALLGIGIGVAAFQGEMAHIRGELRRFLFEFYRGKKLPVCLRCGYDLTGNATDRCPECGANVVMPEK